MKILLISTNTLTAPYPVYPLGLDYVANAIASHHQVRIVDLNQLKTPNQVREVINTFIPDVICLALRNVDNTDTSDPQGFIGFYQHIIRTIRKVSKAVIVLGGSGFTIFPAEMMAALDADFGIIGEGERLGMLLHALEHQQDASEIPGVIAKHCVAPIPEPWDHSFQRQIDPQYPHLKYYIDKGGMLNLQTKRGCSFNCIYCTYPHIEGHRLRLIPPREVAQTAMDLQNAGAKYLFITDSAFNVDYPHSLAVAQAFRQAGVKIPWGAFFAPTIPPKGYFTQMAAAGLSHVEFGTESLSNVILKNYRKPFRVEHVLAAHKAALAANLYIAHYFLLGGPGENQDSLQETLRNIDKLKKTVLFFFCGIRIYPHTALYDIALKNGQISASQDLLEPVFFQSKDISSQEIIRQVKSRADGRSNWIIGAGGEDTAKLVAQLYDRGHSGPLWEYLIR
jgi:radical SAM superfamily enzyme YgiQ (UPF0313 family)